MTSISDPAAHYLRWINELWNGELNQLDTIARDIVSEDFVGHWPGQPQLVTGPDALADVIRQGRLPFKDMTFDIQLGPVVSGDIVSGRWVARGSYTAGEFAIPGAQAEAGTPVEFHGHDFLRFQQGRFCEYWVISEADLLMRQLQVSSSS